MPRKPRGAHPRRLASGQWQLRYQDAAGNRRSGGTFPTQTAAYAHYDNVIAPRLRGEVPTTILTLAAHVDLYLNRHGATRSPRTIQTLRERLRRPVAVFGDIPLRELEGMADVLADWRGTLPARYAHPVMSALRQTLAAAVRWGYMARNPAVLAGENPAPPPRMIRVFTPAELDVITDELPPPYAAVPGFAAATGLRPSEWAALERGHIDRRGGVVHVPGTKTRGSVREVPLTADAVAALDRIPPRLDTPRLFPAPAGGDLNPDNWRRRTWAPAIAAGGVATPARPYDLRSTFASNALAAGVTVFELSRVMGSSVRMIEHHYGTLIGGAHAGITARLDAHAAAQRQVAEQADEGSE
jgi:integrase